MSWHTVSLADVVPSAWKNGGGVTRELLAWPSPADWVFRLSVAEVQADGPFSCFVGVQRWFAVLSGAGVRLRIGAAAPYEEHALTPASAPFCFDGALPVDCTLIDGATQDFNLMVRADQARAQMQRVVGNLQTVAKGPRTVAVWSGDAGADLWLGQECTHVSANTLAWQDLPAKAVLKVMTSNALLMEIDLCP
jgi:environmental stress-induced protein Ves